MEKTVSLRKAIIGVAIGNRLELSDHGRTDLLHLGLGFWMRNVGGRLGNFLVDKKSYWALI